jgi:4-hydroxy-tetrahydrodipicolinate synthase
MLTGSMVAMITPMKGDGSIDWISLEGLVEHHINEDTDAIVSVGTTGESATLTHEEHVEVIDRTVQAVAGRVPVIGGTGSNSTEETIALTRSAFEAGVSACLLVVPYYNKPPQEGLYKHFRTVAEAVPVPQIVYNVPGRTSIDLANKTMLRLAEIDNIIGIKDATNDIERGAELIQQAPPEFAVYSGEDGTACQLMLAGAKGTISVTANVAPNLMHKMCSAAVEGNTSDALEYDKKLADLHGAMFVQSNPIPAKWAVHQQGLVDSGIRLPLVPLQSQYFDIVSSAMTSAGVA